jgi:hypothetical protein
MNKIFKYFLLLAIVCSSYYGMGQSTCATAVTDTMTSKNHYRTHQINRDSVLWVKFTATAVKCKIRIKSILNQTPPTVTRLTLYSGTCNSLTTLSVRNFATQDSLFLIYDGLNINTVYYLKINNSNTADTCHFDLGLLSVITKFDPILYNCDENLICYNKLDDGNFDLSGPPFVFSSNLALTPIWFPWTLYSIYNVVPNAHDARSIWTGYGFDNGGGPDDFFVADGFDWGGTFNTAWTENVTVTAGATYYFSFAVSNVDNNEKLNPVVQFWINGAPVQINNIASDTYHVPWGHNVWQQLCGEWTAPGSGTYSVPIAIMDTVEDGDAGNDFGLDHIVFGPLNIIAEAGNNDTICLGESTVLMATGGNAYYWSPATGLSCTNCQNPVASPTTTTTYTVTVYNDACESYDMVTVYVTTKPDPPTISGEFNTCHGNPPITINNIDNWNGAYTYHYFIGTGGVHHLFSSTPFQVNWTGHPNGGMLYVEVKNGSHCTALDSFKVFDCCRKTNTPLFADTILSTPQTYTGECFINGVVTINASINIGSTTAPGIFEMGANAKIVINPGYTLTIKKSSVVKAGCNTMWDGIYIDGTTAHLIIKDTSLVKDAKNAIYSTNGGDFQLSNSDTLKNNYRNVVVSNYAGTHPGRISKTTIKCDLGVPLLAQYPPVTAARTSVGIQIGNVNKIYIGDTTAFSKRNTFYNMDYGISASCSQIYIYNNKFQNMNAPAFGTVGTAVYAFGARNCGNTTTVGAANVLPNIVRSNYFDNCYNGIYFTTSTGGTIKAEYDTLVMQTTASTTPTGIYAYAASTSNITMRYNKITNGNYGINCVNTGDASTVNISSNYIEKAKTGIAATNVNLTMPYNFQIANNSVNYPSTYIYTNGTTGILVTNVLGERTFESNRPFAYITTNRVIFTSPNLSYTTYGIRVQNSKYTRIELNYVQNNGTAASSDAQAVRLNGIVDEVGPYSVVGCNKVVKMGCGFRFYGSMPNSKIKMDTTNNTWWGIRLDTANVGAQGGSMSSNANVWLGTQTWRLQGTWTPVYWYSYNLANLTLVPNGTYVSLISPPPAGYIVNASGYLTTCGTLVPYTMMSMLQDIVYDQTNYPYAASENKYADDVTAYTTLKTDTALYDEATSSDPNIKMFYNTADAGNIGSFDRVNDMIVAGDYATATVMNSALSPANMMEANKKQTNEIYLNTWAQGRFDFTPDEYDALYAIAMQRPVLGGCGVYSARVMLGVEGEGMESYRLAKPIPDAINQNIAGLIYPNPVRDEANIDYQIKSGEKAVLSIYGIVGSKLMEFNLNKEENHFSFSTAQLNSGVYFYQLLIDGNAISNNKFIIVK